jgi:copper chaperone CopZ
MKKQQFRVEDMHCVNCALRLQELEDTLPGVKSVHASYRTGKMVVEFEEAKTTNDQIIQAVRKLGYTAVIDS